MLKICQEDHFDTKIAYFQADELGSEAWDSLAFGESTRKWLKKHN